MKNLFSVLLAGIIIFTFTSCNINSSVEESDTSHKQLLSVLNSQTSFTAENGTEFYLKNFVYGSDETAEYYASPSTYAFVDFNSDGIDELVADISSNQTYYIVFHIADNGVHGFLFGNRSLQSIKDDGSFVQTGGADSNYFCRMEFDDNSYKIINTAVKDEYIGKYEIAENQCTTDELDKYIKQWYSKANIEWQSISEISTR